MARLASTWLGEPEPLLPRPAAHHGDDALLSRQHRLVMHASRTPLERRKMIGERGESDIVEYLSHVGR